MAVKHQISTLQDISKLQAVTGLRLQATVVAVQGSLEETIVAMGCRRRRQAPLGRAANGEDDASRFTVRDAVMDAVRSLPCAPPGVPCSAAGWVSEGRWPRIGIGLRLKY